MTEGPLGKPLDGQDWISSYEAAKILQVCRNIFNNIARKSQLTRHYPQRQKFPCWFLRHEIEELARARQDQAKRRRRERKIVELDITIAPDRFLTSKQAAAGLGIALPTLYNMVRLGRLHAYRKPTGNPYEHLYFSLTEIEQLRADPERNASRQRHKNDRHTYIKRVLQIADTEPPFEQTPARPGKQTPEGWLTTHQAAFLLKITPQRVRDMIREGRLEGLRRYHQGQPIQRWFVHVNQVQALKNDPAFIKHHNRYYDTRDGQIQESQQATSRLIARHAAEVKRNLNSW